MIIRTMVDDISLGLSILLITTMVDDVDPGLSILFMRTMVDDVDPGLSTSLVEQLHGTAKAMYSTHPWHTPCTSWRQLCWPASALTGVG